MSRKSSTGYTDAEVAEILRRRDAQHARALARAAGQNVSQHPYNRDGTDFSDRPPDDRDRGESPISEITRRATKHMIGGGDPADILGPPPKHPEPWVEWQRTRTPAKLLELMSTGVITQEEYSNEMGAIDRATEADITGVERMALLAQVERTRRTIASWSLPDGPMPDRTRRALYVATIQGGFLEFETRAELDAHLRKTGEAGYYRPETPAPEVMTLGMSEDERGEM